MTRAATQTTSGGVVTTLLADTEMSQSSSPCGSHSRLPLACNNEPPSNSQLPSPPISFVIVRDSGVAAPPSPIRLSAASSSLSCVHQSVNIRATSRAATSPLASPFKLQPRHSRCIPPAGGSRGRKRGAGSISSTIFSDSTCHGYPDEKQVGEQDTVSTTLLEEDTITPPMTFFHPSAATPSDGVDHAAASFHALTITTPKSMNCGASSFVGSQVHLLGRSSFSKYAGSPAGSLRSASNSPSASISNLSKASPGAKIAPLRVLSSSDSGTTPVRNGSTCRTIGESSEAMHLKPPPSVVHCTSSDTGVDTSFLEEDEEDYSVARAPPSSAVESSSRRSIASMSERTPLPKVSLTPRSHGSRISQLPRFPSPEGDYVDSEFFLRTPSDSRAFGMTPPRSARTSQDVCLESFGFFVDDNNNVQDRPQNHRLEESSAGAPLENLEDDCPLRQHQSESFIPLPDWGSGFPSFPRIMHPGSIANYNDMHAMFDAGQESTYDPNATAGLAGTMRRSSLELLQPTLDLSQDTGSLSASDDEDAFFLVPPSKYTDLDEGQHRSKQRRLQGSSEAERHRFSFASSVGHASNASLLGMGFVPSSTSLHGLCSSNSLRGLDGSTTLGIRRREESSASIGLALDQAPNTDEGRALMTPPIMPEPKSPPPLLSPRPGVLPSSNDED